MNNLPRRKSIRIEDYDYSMPGAYFITFCTANREKILWYDRRGELCSPADNVQRGDQRSLLRIELSDIGRIVDHEIKKLNSIYDAVRIDKYCIMPDHIHMILVIDTDADGRTQRPYDVIRKCTIEFVGAFFERPRAHTVRPYG